MTAAAPAKGNSGTLLVALLLAALTVLVFLPALDNQFVQFDDELTITGNVHVRTGITLQSIAWAWKTLHIANWHPLTWLSHMMDVQLFGLDPRGHHLTSIILHLLNTLLLFMVMRSMTGALWRSAAVAALFAVHPLHVESVAWVSERKDVLSTFFGLLCLGSYVRYARKPGPARYLPVVVAFALGLMSKPMLVTLPLLLLLLDGWPLGRVRLSAPPASHRRPRINLASLGPLVLEKAPLLALSAAASAVTVIAQSRSGAIAPFQQVDLSARVSNALVSYVRYLVKAAWPVDLSVYYPLPAGGHPIWQVAGSGLLLLVLPCLVVRFWRRPYLAVGSFWYLVALIPVIGLVQVGDQAMADRYSYLPLIGIFILAVWGVEDLIPPRNTPRAVLAAVSVTALLILSILTKRQIGYWHDSQSLFEHALQVDDKNWRAHENLGIALGRQGRLDAAAREFSRVLELNPLSTGAHDNLGVALMRLGRYREAELHFRTALRFNPEDVDAYYNLGSLMTSAGMPDQAIAFFREALRIKPDDAQSHLGLGDVLIRKGLVDEALEHYREAIRLEPDNATARRLLDEALRISGGQPGGATLSP